MAIYDFSLASMYEVTGVDKAISFRARLLAKLGYDVKLVFTVPPYARDLMLYKGMGIEFDQMLVVHHFYTDNRNLAPTLNVREMVNYLKTALQCSGEDQEYDRIILKKDGKKVASVLLTEDKTSFYCIDYYYASDENRTTRTDFYSDVLYATNFYDIESGAVTNRFLYNRDGSVALIQNFWETQEINILPNGSRYNAQQLFALFVQKLNLSSEDYVILDRAFGIFPAKELLRCHDKTNIIAVFHSEHFYRKGFSYTGEHLSWEYWYWCKYSKYIKCMIVGTEEQREELKKTLAYYQIQIPDLCVVPPLCLDKLRYPQKIRKRKSVVCVTRLDRKKKIEWTILAVVKAHESDSEITLDIYGQGVRNDYIGYLVQLIERNRATNYIHLKGYINDAAEIYQEYEIFLTTSLSETFGISLLEAVGSGLAMVGLDVRYGNQLFIEDGKNGYLVNYNPEHLNFEWPAEVDTLAEKLILTVSDENKLRMFSERSYQIAKKYMYDQVERKWDDLLHLQKKT